MIPLRIVFMGSSSFALPTLAALLESEWELAGVVTQPDRPRGRGRKREGTPVKEFCAARGLPVFQPESLRDADPLGVLRQWHPDVIVVAAYGQLLPEAVLALPPRGCINLHPSLLPAYRGAAPIIRAVMNGEEKTGVTTFYMTTRLDAGDIILQEEVPIDRRATAGEVAALLAERGARLVATTLSLVATGRAPRIPQDEARASYAPALKRGEEVIDWSLPAEKLYNMIRGMNPVPGAHTYFRGKILKIWYAEVYSPRGGGPPPGTVVELLPREGFVVQAGEGKLLVREVQPAGKARMGAPDFLRGYRIAPGFALGE